MTSTPIVLVHGNPETPDIWDLLVDRLREHDLPAPTRLSPPGFGAPVPDGFAPSPLAYRDWLIAALEDIGEAVHVVGHDWGGAHVALTAMHRPDLLRSWVSDAVGVLDPGYVWHPLAQMWQEPGAGEDWVRRQLSLTLPQRAAGYAALGIDAQVAAPVAAGFDDHMGAAILSLYRAAAQPVMAELGAGLAAAGRRPGLVVIALDDDAVGTVDARRHAAARAGARTAELDAGHWWMTEHDGRDAAEALIGFWDELA